MYARYALKAGAGTLSMADMNLLPTPQVHADAVPVYNVGHS